ncbi:tRNA dimethylallyltransferase [Candidatus Shapirobacteria bacterium]|nr:tRNA dimethylallyltransferase [Candidatus Shapirobacteria bacterium]
MRKKKKLLVIYGPTAIGKTSLGIKLARQLGGEIISADSRQVYRGMDIGTGKDFPLSSKFQITNIKQISNNKYQTGYYLFKNVKVWLLDVITPDQRFSAYQWSLLAKKVIKDIWARGKLPILAGGSAFYLKALLDGLDTQGIKPDWDLRAKLGKLSLEKLQQKAGEINPLGWKKLNQSDQNNPRRLMRLIEVGSGKSKGRKSDFLKEVSVFGIYLDASLEFIKKRIEKRIEQRLDQGLVDEIKALLKKYSWSDPGLNCLAYKEFKEYFGKKESLKEGKLKWLKDEIDYARRQKLWFRNDKRFTIFNKEEKNYLDKIREKVKQWDNEEEKES